MVYLPQGLGLRISDADAAVEDVRSPKTFYSVERPRKTGTMPTQTLSPASENVPAGYYAATTLSAVDPDLGTPNIKSGITIFGKVGSDNVRDSTDADAALTDVLSPKTFYAGGGARKTGTCTSPDHDAQNQAHSDGSASSGTKWKTIFTVPAGSEVDRDSINITLAKKGAVEAQGCGSIVGTYNDVMKLRLYINGVQVAESGLLGVNANISNKIQGYRSIAAAGTITVKTTIYNTSGSEDSYTLCNSFVFGGAVK